ncbi:hypothetical protein BDV97DRAFT_403818 [Delphinella strobiligena]|nr:hypothetical protein BDV97DRAFT_403818 [Delphinella strobiligena]
MLDSIETEVEVLAGRDCGADVEIQARDVELGAVLERLEGVCDARRALEGRYWEGGTDKAPESLNEHQEFNWRVSLVMMSTQEFDDSEWGGKKSGEARKRIGRTAAGIPTWSPTVVLISRSTAYVWQSGRDAQFSAAYGRT